MGISILAPLTLEATLRAVNLVFPLEEPASLKDTFHNRWLDGYDWRNGYTRLYNYRDVPNATTHGHPFRVNRWGFRGEDFLARQEEGPNTFRVMVLGDSLTVGQGIAEEDRYSNLLEKRLREKYPSVKIEVINLGVQGFETLQELRILTALWDTVGPNLVIVGFSSTDPNLHYRHFDPIRLPITKTQRNFWERWLLFRIVERSYDEWYRRLRHIPTHQEEIYSAYDPASADWGTFVKCVAAIGKFVQLRNHSAPYVIFLEDVEHEKKEGRYGKVRSVFEQNNFIWVETAVKGAFKSISRFERHPGPLANKVSADALYDRIVGTGVIDKWEKEHLLTAKATP